MTDFYCHSLKLVIEVDGSVHLLEEIHENDVNREADLCSFGLTVIRFTNDEVEFEIEKVLTSIDNKILELINQAPFKGSSNKSPLENLGAGFRGKRNHPSPL